MRDGRLGLHNPTDEKGPEAACLAPALFSDFTGPFGVASLARGSEIVFEYYLPKSLVDEEDRRRLVTLKALGAAREGRD
jgi:hypothetical protein